MSLGMLPGIMPLIQHLPVLSVESHIQGLATWRCTRGLVLDQLLLLLLPRGGSGWVFSNFSSLQLTFWHLDPLRPSAFVPLPRWIKDKKGVTNIIGIGNDCFKWDVLAGMYPATGDHPNCMENYVQYAGEYDFSSLRFAVPSSSIASIATENNLSINVYGVEDEKEVIYPLRVAETIIPDRHVDLLLHERNGVQHYSTIRNFSRVISGQLSRHDGDVYCHNKCLHAYSTKELLAAHSVDWCHVQRTKFPKDPICRFTNIQNPLPAPFVVDADFESTLKPVSEDVAVAQRVDTGTGSFTTIFQEHVPRLQDSQQRRYGFFASTCHVPWRRCC